jgi:hypothetical protein
LAAVKAAEEAKERVKTAGLPSPMSEQVDKDPLALTRALQAELKHVGCDPGAVDGQWGKQAKEALANFAQLAKVSLTVEEPTQDALQAVAICAANVKSVGEAEAKRRAAVRAKAAPEGESNKPMTNSSTCYSQGALSPWCGR